MKAIKKMAADVLEKIKPLYFSRPLIREVQKQNKKNLVGAEIGVGRGVNSRNIFRVLDMKILYGIDPFNHYMQGGVNIHRYVDSDSYGTAINRLKGCNVKFIKKTSEDAADEIPDSCLDFLYIDGNHNYKSVKKDIKLYYGKVKIGGIFGGHDFFGECQGVCRAVVEFTNKKKLDLHTKKRDWWVVKKMEVT